MFERSVPDRRRFLCDAGLATLPLLFGGKLLAEKPDPLKLIPRNKEKEADNLEFPFHSLNSFITPNDLFYVRNHFAQPTIKGAVWRLKVVGSVQQELDLTLEDVKAMAQTSMPLTLECAGNGRSFLVPTVKGVLWEKGAVSTAKWTGVPLAAVLKRAKVNASAVEVILEGTDEGEVKNEPKPTETITFSRSLPMAKAKKPEVLLAYKMNDLELPAAHGYPLRAVVGGWYGMASVKWLRRIIVTDRPYLGYWQTTDYSTWETHEKLPIQVPITQMQVKALIAQPTEGAELPAGKAVRIHGAAWAGESAVVKVEISTDGGKTWVEAKLLDESIPLCWRLWEYNWKEPVAGKATLMARAMDALGRLQPMKHDLNHRNYVISHSVPTVVTVR